MAGSEGAGVIYALLTLKMNQLMSLYRSKFHTKATAGKRIQIEQDAGNRDKGSNNS